MELLNTETASLQKGKTPPTKEYAEDDYLLRLW